MAIRFDQLPQEKPGGAVPEKGKYRIKIEKAAMQAPKTAAAPGQPAKSNYLALTLALLAKEDGTPATGKIFDNITESDSDYVRYKVKRFIEALKIPVTTSIELKDIAKIVQGKELYADITVDEKATPPRGVVDIFSAEIFYPLDEAAADAPINAPDAADATPEATATTTY